MSDEIKYTLGADKPLVTMVTIHPEYNDLPPKDRMKVLEMVQVWLKLEMHYVYEKIAGEEKKEFGS